MKITVDKTAWRNFVRRAKYKFPKEYIEYLWGKETKAYYHITRFIKIPHTATQVSIYCDEGTFACQQKLAKAQGLTCLGSIHTHPHYKDCSASQTDHEESYEEGEKIIGILALYKNNKINRLQPYIRWWVPQPIMDFILKEGEDNE
jgi:proteasome lid subunit RPN8/RPN11